MSALQRFRAYPAYKDSGVEWLGEIPAHWEVKRLKTLASVQLSNVDKKSIDGQEPVRLCNYTDVYYNERITPDLEFMTATATREQVRRFSLQAGDVLITKDSESWTDIAVPAVVVEDLADVLCGYHLAHVRPGSGLAGAFLSRAFSAIGTRDQFRVAANGITRFGLGGDAIRTSLFAMPPQLEQRAIAAFLDRETARIDALVAKKERLIELLREKRAALITCAVTRGLDPTVPMKESGVEWLGEIPAHWEHGALRRFWSVIDCKHRTAVYVFDGLPIVSTTEVKPGRIALDGPRRVSEADFTDLTEGGRRPRRGDIVYSRNASLGAAAYVDTEEPFCMGQDVCLITSGRDQLYLAYQLNSPVMVGQIEAVSVGSTFERINIAQIKTFAVVCPPISEQAAIATFLDRETARIDALVAKVREAIERLKELRTALISAAVTGKIDVREEARA